MSLSYTPIGDFQNGRVPSRSGCMPPSHTLTRAPPALPPQSSKVKGIPKGAHGVILSTVTGKERMAAREAIAILSEALEELGGPTRDSDDCKIADAKAVEEEDQSHQGGAADISALLKAEVDDMKDKSKQDFFVRDMGLPSTVFLGCNFSSPSPSDMVFHVLDAVRKSKQNKSRFCHRWFPVEYTCRAELEEIKAMGKKVVEAHFGADRKESKFSVDVAFRAKPKELERLDVINAFADEVRQPPWKVDLNAPELTILVNVVKGTSGCAVVRGYRDLSRYNLSLLATPAEDDASDGAEVGGEEKEKEKEKEEKEDQ